MPDEACFRQWDPIMQEWLYAQGGMASSIPAIHESILRDRSTRFSRVVKSVWRSQESKAHETWPPDQITLSRYFTEAVSNELRDSVTNQCRSPAWIKPLLVETPGAFSSGAKKRLLHVAPEKAGADDRNFAHWLTYEILSRPTGHHTN